MVILFDSKLGGGELCVILFFIVKRLNKQSNRENKELRKDILFND